MLPGSNQMLNKQELLNYCIFSEDVYLKSGRRPIPADWQEFKNPDFYFSGWGYYGKCYIKQEELNHYQVIFSHRGTIFSIKNLLEDLYIALDAVPSAYTRALEFIKSTLKLLISSKSSDTTFIVSHTGHSLGAAIAEIVGAFRDESVVSLESPGTRDMIQKLVENGILSQNTLQKTAGKVIQLMADVNFINTYNNQVSLPYTCILKPYNLEPNFNWAATIIEKLMTPAAHIGEYYYDNPYYYTTYALSQHMVDNFSAYLEEKEPILQTSWPVGLANGYKAYKSVKRLDYWKQYVNDLDSSIDFDKWCMNNLIMAPKDV